MGCSSSSPKPQKIKLMTSSKLENEKFKVVLLGDSSVGKTSIVNRYVSETFDDTTPATVGSSYSEKLIRTPKNRRVTLSIWDTGGQERYRCLAPIYYREAAAAVIVFSVNDRSSLKGCEAWIKELALAQLNSVIVIVANKIDTRPRLISEEEGKNFAKDRLAIYIEVSAKLGRGIQELFTMLAERLTHEEASK